MSTFLFNDSNGTTLEQMNPNFEGDTSGFIAANGTLSVNARNSSFNAWLTGTYGDVTYSVMQFTALTDPWAIVSWPAVQKSAVSSGYTLSMQSDGRVYVDRNGSWGGYFDNIRGTFDPATTAFIMAVEYNQSTGELICRVNGVEAGRTTDGVPLVGGYPGFSTGGAGGTAQAGDQSVNSAWSNEATPDFSNPPVSVVLVTPMIFMSPF